MVHKLILTIQGNKPQKSLSLGLNAQTAAYMAVQPLRWTLSEVENNIISDLSYDGGYRKSILLRRQFFMLEPYEEDDGSY
jgi:hypothetical protein